MSAFAGRDKSRKIGVPGARTARTRLRGSRAFARMDGPRLGRTLRQRQLARRPRQCDDYRFSVRARDPRDDIAIGASLLAPNVRYPDHSHPPEEVYLLLTPGRFQHGDSDWIVLAPGETLHNEPRIKHAMASDDGPLLAFWCLLIQ